MHTPFSSGEKKGRTRGRLITKASCVEVNYINRKHYSFTLRRVPSNLSDSAAIIVKVKRPQSNENPKVWVWHQFYLHMKNVQMEVDGVLPR